MIIKNCPAFEELDCTSPTEHEPYATACEHIEDCLLKQIVNICKQSQKPIYEGKTRDIYLKNPLAEKILKKLEIEEE